MSTKNSIYRFFKLKPFCHAPKWNGSFELKKHRLPRNFHQFIWFIFSFGKFKEYYIINTVSQEVICSAEVMPKIFIFKFMDKKGIHIGPCFTNPNYRGFGFYPHIVSLIINQCKKNTSNFYIFCSENNTPSLKGIISMKGKEIGKGYKDRFGIYRLYDERY